MPPRPPSPGPAPRPKRPARGTRGTVRGAGTLLTSTVVIFFAIASVANAASFYGLGTLGGGTSDTRVEGMTEDGSKLVGRITSPGGSLTAPIVYGEQTLLLEAGQSAAAGTTGSNTGIDRVVSANGTKHFSVGHSLTSGGVRVWFEAYDIASDTVLSTNTVPSHPTPSFDMLARGVGRNRRILFQATHSSSSTTQAAFYDVDTGLFTNLSMEIASDIDAAGRRIVGRSAPNGSGDVQAVVWDEVYGSTALGTLEGAGSSQALGVSPSGRIIVGSSESTNVAAGQQEPFRWHADLGMRRLVPIQDGGARGEALAASDANEVVGSYFVGGAPPQTRAFIWTPTTGRIDLANYLSNQVGLGDSIAGWTLTEATQISADGRIIAGQGRNPFGNPTAWIVDLDGAQRAEVRMRSADPTNSPVLWDFYLQCGDVPIEELYFGAIMPASFGPSDTFNFADCDDDTVDPASLYCTNSATLGPNVSPASSFIRAPYSEPSSLPEFRNDALYFHLVGQGGSQNETLCEPGDAEVALGSLEIDSGTPGLTRSALDGLHGHSPSGPLADEEVVFVHQPLSPAISIRLQPSLDDVNGTRWIVILESDVALHSLSFGLIAPPSTQSIEFGGCDTEPPMPGGFNERICPANPDLGQNVDPAGSRTIGPSGNFSGTGLRTDTLYAYVEGKLSGPTSLPALNVAGKPTPLGVLQLGSPPPLDFAFMASINFDNVQQLPLFFADIGPWTDPDGNDVTAYSVTSGSIVDPLPGDDSDGDFLEDSVDLCPFVPSPFGLADAGTLAQYQGATQIIAPTVNDGIGDECQCGNSSQDGVVESVDLGALQMALLLPGTAGEFFEPYKCNAVGPVDNASIDPETGLTHDCNIADLYALLRARNASAPLVPAPGTYPAPGSLVQCPDMYAPPQSP